MVNNIRNVKCALYDVFSFKQNNKVCCSFVVFANNFCVIIQNTVEGFTLVYTIFRTLVIKAENDREADEWKREIESALNGKGKIWKETNQFGSFFPVRQHSYAQW